jgi:hypothetical protein
MDRNMKKYRFFFHYKRSEHKMTVHFKKQCTSVSDVQCHVPVQTKWNKVQPHIVLQGFASEVIFESDKAIIK